MARKIQKENALRKRLIGVLFFIIKFNLLVIPLYVAILLGIENTKDSALQNFLKYAAFVILSDLGYKIDPSSIEITMDCTGWKSMYALIALVIATPKSNFRNKIKFLLLSVPAIFLINIARIVSTTIVALNYGVEAGRTVDSFLWSFGMIASVLIIWYLWLRDKIVK